jgi:carboxyl-terminal processing protease
MLERARLSLIALALATGASTVTCRRSTPPSPVTRGGAPKPALQNEADAEDGQCSVRALELPSGAPPQLSCRDARRIIKQVRDRLADPVVQRDEAHFAELLTGWLDPHGLWSAAPDAPARALIRSTGQDMFAELELNPRAAEPCTAAERIGEVTRSWVEELRTVFTEAEQQAPFVGDARAFSIVSEDAFEDDPVTRPARTLARELGRRSGVLRQAYGPSGARAAGHAAERLFPALSRVQWTEVVLAAAVRSYVPSVDVHSQWAPLDEEWTLYAADAAAPAPERLWRHVARTVAGVRVLGSSGPLHDGDVVLRVGGVATAGLSVEQVEQLAVLEPIAGEALREVELLRAGDARPRVIGLQLAADASAEQHVDSAEPALTQTRVRYGRSEVLVISVPDVSDWLGDALAEIVAARASDPPAGIVLDLRGNGGGSTDGAAAALGVFLPAVPSFPLRRRDGGIEIDRTVRAAPDARWSGPVAALVDGYTASAAEMIAGALESYDRGPIMGSRTFGKGCIQEYFDDRAGAGVLRLTTMVFALPDGSPVQGVGLKPTIDLPLAAPAESEALFRSRAAPWTGPDVREPSAMGGARWPNHGGSVGPCGDPVLCTALRRLGPSPDRRPGPQAAAPALPGPNRAN